MEWLVAAVLFTLHQETVLQILSHPLEIASHEKGATAVSDYETGRVVGHKSAISFLNGQTIDANRD